MSTPGETEHLRVKRAGEGLPATAILSESNMVLVKLDGADAEVPLDKLSFLTHYEPLDVDSATLMAAAIAKLDEADNLVELIVDEWEVKPLVSEEDLEEEEPAPTATYSEYVGYGEGVTPPPDHLTIFAGALVDYVDEEGLVFEATVTGVNGPEIFPAADIPSINLVFTRDGVEVFVTSIEHETKTGPTQPRWYWLGEAPPHHEPLGELERAEVIDEILSMLIEYAAKESRLTPPMLRSSLSAITDKWPRFKREIFGT